MALCVRLESNPNQLRFEEFPTIPLKYQEDIPLEDPSFVHLNVTDTQTNQILLVFLKAIDLQKIGISISTWKEVSHNSGELSKLLKRASDIEHYLRGAIPVVSKYLTSQHLMFFMNNASYAIRLICRAIHTKIEHLSKIEGVPGMYFHPPESCMHIFINLKKVPPLGIGSFGKVRKVLWLNAPKETSKIVAKKVSVNNSSQFHSMTFIREIAALSTFSGKRGIISMIAAGTYKDKFVIFLPAYECSMLNYFNKKPFFLSLNKKLNLISQWLEGLAIISEKGIHGDIKPGNLLIRRGEEGIKGAIADFGAYCPHDQTEFGLTTIAVAPPEYYAEGKVTLKHDIWGMGLSLYEFFTNTCLPCWYISSAIDMKLWTSKLTSNWILQHPTQLINPPFVLNLINQMLEPRHDHRPSPTEAFEHFSAGYSSYLQLQ